MILKTCSYSHVSYASTTCTSPELQFFSDYVENMYQVSRCKSKYILF